MIETLIAQADRLAAEERSNKPRSCIFGSVSSRLIAPVSGSGWRSCNTSLSVLRIASERSNTPYVWSHLIPRYCCWPRRPYWKQVTTPKSYNWLIRFKVWMGISDWVPC